MPDEKGENLRLPPWIRSALKSGAVHPLKSRLRDSGLETVCEQARCPNIGECFALPTATFMILGKICTRNCGFCAVAHGKPNPLDPDEPSKVAEMAHRMGLSHVVITSVTRDDLPDGGASHFAQTVRAVRKMLPDATVETLIPDFSGDADLLKIVAGEEPHVLNHNVETIADLYSRARPQADFRRSLALLENAAGLLPDSLIKSGFMVGLGENDAQVKGLMQTLRNAGVQAVTIGQYLRPRLSNLPVERYVDPARFEIYKQWGDEIGFRFTASGPMVRSSYMAHRALQTKS